MHTPQQMEERLWDYIDGLSSSGERSAIEELIAVNIEWQQKYRELLNVHGLMASSELDVPSMRFTKNVMEEISRYHVAPATKTYINKNVIRSIGAMFLIMLTGCLIYCFRQFKWMDSGSSSSLPQLNINMDKLNLGKYINSTYASIFMLIAVILGLMLLDAYLHRQKEKAVNS